jgi:16S rRNA (cytosine1402-N4)-methyltransferase
MAVNDELAELDAGLESALESLAQGGRLAVLSYHSGEDRRVKQFMAREAKGCICPPDLPVCGCGQVPRLRIVARGTKPSPSEIRRNPRARSARLRGGERC